MRRRQDNNKALHGAWRAVAGGAGVAAALAAVLVWVSGEWGEAPEAVVELPAAAQAPASAAGDSAAQQPAPSVGAPAKSAPMPSAGGPSAASAPASSADDSAADSPTPPAAPETVKRMKQALQRIKSASMPPSEAAIDGKRERLLVTRRPGMAEMHNGPFSLLAAMREVRINHLGALDITIVEVPVGWDLEHLRQIIAEDPSVESASRDNVVRAQGRVVPNDPDFGEQSNLDHDSGADVNAPEAWAYTTGSEEVVVAVIDSGIDYSHLDLLPNLWVNEAEANGVAGEDDDGNGYVDDIYGINAVLSTTNTDPRRGDPWDDAGHGTGVASVIGARGNNGALLAGVNWNVRIMSIKTIGADNRGLSSDIVTGINYIITMRRNRNVNVKAVNVSIGFPIDREACRPTSTRLGSLYRAVTRLGEAGILFVTSAGNDGRDIDAPGEQSDAPGCFDHENLIAVGSQGFDANSNRHLLTLYTRNNYGAISVDLAAPGRSIPAAGISSAVFRIPQSRKKSVNSGTVIFSDSTDTTAAAGWMADPPWEETTRQSLNSLYSWTDSPDGHYTGSQNISLTSPPIDLSASTPGEVWLFLRADIRTNLEYRFGSNVPCRLCDALYLEMSRSSTTSWTTREVWGGDNGWREMSVAIPAWGYGKDFRFRFRLRTNAGDNRDGVYIDNIRIVSHATGADTTNNRFGTSYASPHVAGAAALLWAHRPDLSVREVRAALLNNVDLFTDLTDRSRVASGGALNIANALFSVTEPGIRIHSSQTAVREGDNGYLDVSLTREPRGTPGSVVVRVTTATAGRITALSASALTFTQENWHLPQRINFETLAGFFPTDPVETLQLSVDAAQSDPAYAAVSRAAAVQVDVERGIYIHASQTTVMEGANGYISISLTRAPSDAGQGVLLQIAASDPGRVLVGRQKGVRFRSYDWHRPQTVGFTVFDDQIVQPTTAAEFLQISVDAAESDPAWTAVSRSVAVQFINNDLWSISTTQLTVREGGSATVGLAFHPLPQDVSMTITARYSGGGRPDDHITPAEIHAAAGSTDTRFTIRITDDEKTETMETVYLEIRPSSPDVLGTEAMSVNVTIPANDPIATLAVSPTLLVEGGSAVVTVRLNIPVSNTVMFNIGAEPENPARYSLLGNPLTIAPGATHGSVTLSAPDNGVQEEGQTVTLTYRQTPGSPVSVIRGDPSTAQLRIVDDLLLIRLRVFLEGTVSTDGRSTAVPDPP